MNHFLRLGVLLVLSGMTVLAQGSGSLDGRVIDPRGATVAGARVTLLQGGAAIAEVTADGQGRFRFTSLGSGSYTLRVEQSGFTPQVSGDVYLPRGGAREVEIILQVGPLQESMVVTPLATEQPEAQTGAAISLIGADTISRHDRLAVHEAIRFSSGLQVAQSGGEGSLTTLFLRGGDSNFHKVLIDGVPANDIGGLYDFSSLTTDHIERIEVLRGPNSVVYGSDAVSGVINVLSRRGREQTKIPFFHYRIEGGNFGTFRQAVGLHGAFRTFDYASVFSRLDTNNNVPNETFHNATYTGNFGWKAGARTEVRFTLRHLATALGAPNALELYGIPDDSAQRRRDTYLGVGVVHQTTGKWRNQLRFNSAQLETMFTNPAPTGTAFDPFGFGPNYLGLPATIVGGNGFRVTGRAILDFGGSYPALFRSDTTRQSLYAQSEYRPTENLLGTFGFRYENERGASGSTKGDRDNFGYFLQGQYSLAARLFATVGMGFEDNAVFGFDAHPRVSVAYYPRSADGRSAFNETKLRFSYGTGIKEPGLFEEGQSLFRILSTGDAASRNLIARSGLGPIGPERSRSFDAGLDQHFWNRRARLSITVFHNRFEDLIEFVPKSAVPLLGISSEVANALSFGAYINSQSFRAVGAEIQASVDLGRGWSAEGNYTYLDAVVTRSFSSDALSPSLNPAFPGVPIGQFSPLVGQRPFQRSPRVGNLLVGYERSRGGVSASAYFVGPRDGSTFLSDEFFGPSLLLPNRDLNPAYQRVDAAGHIKAHERITLFATINNLLNRRYTETFGYPALGFNIRAGARFTWGGESVGGRQ